VCFIMRDIYDDMEGTALFIFNRFFYMLVFSLVVV